MNTSTQVQHPWRTTLRTIVWLLIALAPTVPTLWAIVQDEVTKAGLVIPDNVAAVVAYGVALIVAVVGIVQRVVLIPAVAALIAEIPGLSPAPVVIPGEIVGPVVDVPVVPEFVVQDETGVITTHYSDKSTTTDPGIGNPPTTSLS